MCGRYCVNHTRVINPVNPSPTPWNHNTWGFYCDTCQHFFDLMEDGRVVTVGFKDNACLIAYEHKICGQSARYIGYDHSKQ